MMCNMHTDILFNRSRGGIFMGKKAVVLSGGGAKGGYQIGVWKVLRQMKMAISSLDMRTSRTGTMPMIAVPQRGSLPIAKK